MSELISGKEALIALANGEEVECRAYEKNWINANNNHHPLNLFFDDSFQFRLKPRTITINGVELNQCYSVAIDYTELKVSVVLRNKEDTCVLYNLLADLYSFK